MSRDTRRSGPVFNLYSKLIIKFKPRIQRSCFYKDLLKKEQIDKLLRVLASYFKLTDCKKYTCIYR